MKLTKQNDVKVRQSPEHYHHYTGGFTRPWDEILISRFIEEFTPTEPGSLVVDVGTGTAVLLLMLCEREEMAGVRFLGLDFFDDMVERGRSAVADAGLDDRIELRQADAHATGLEDHCADAVLCRATMHHLRHPADAYAEMYRLLKPGAPALIHDMRRDAPQAVLTRFQELREEAGFVPTILEEKYTVAEVRAQITAAGLDDVARVASADDGPASLGYEVLMRRPLSENG